MGKASKHRWSWLGDVLLAYALVLQMVLGVPLAARHDLSMALPATSDEHALCLPDPGAPSPAGDRDHHEACCIAACAAGSLQALAPTPAWTAPERTLLAFAPGARPGEAVLPRRGTGRGPAPRAPPVDRA